MIMLQYRGNVTIPYRTCNLKSVPGNCPLYDGMRLWHCPPSARVVTRMWEEASNWVWITIFNIILMKFSSWAALEVVILTVYSAVNDENVVILIFLFPCNGYKGFYIFLNNFRYLITVMIPNQDNYGSIWSYKFSSYLPRYKFDVIFSAHSRSTKPKS